MSTIPTNDGVEIFYKAERHAGDLQGFPHDMPTTQADIINADLLAFIEI